MGTGIRNLFEESVSQITAIPSISLGTRRWENGNEYVYVYNTGTTAAVGYGLIQSSNSGYSVTVSAALKDRCFGVVQNTDLTTNYYGWAQVKGKANIAISADHVTAAAGMGFYLVANGSFGAVTTGATGSTYAAMEAGYTLESIGTAQTGAVYLTCRG
jgi:hypothetical protein